MFFKNLKVFRLADGLDLSEDAFQIALSGHELDAEFSNGSHIVGWAKPTPTSYLTHIVNGQILLTMRSQKKLLPATVVKQKTAARAADIERQQGYKPGRKQLKEIKEQVTDELLPTAFSVYRDTNVWIDPVNRWLVIDTSTNAVADEVISLLAKTFDPIPLEQLYVAESPAAAMTSWLAADEAPTNFTIDQDSELRSSGESRAAIRHINQSIDAEDVQRHIQGGKQCTKLALTWADRISFVLTESLDIKRVKPLDVLKEINQDEDKFDSDFVMMAGELNKMLNELVEALGGEK